MNTALNNGLDQERKHDKRTQRLHEKLRQKQRHQAPYFQCFNRWLFLARHNKIMFEERARLAKLQKEYENGLRNGESLKKEAQRIVKDNLANMTTITTLCKTKTIILILYYI